METIGFRRSKQTRKIASYSEPTNRENKAFLGAGLGGALLASVCCLLPALALAVGFGGAAGLVELGQYQPYLLVVSVVFVVGFNLYLVQRRKNCCTTADQVRALYFWAIASVVIFLVAYMVVNYALVPWLYGIRSGGMPEMPI